MGSLEKKVSLNYPIIIHVQRETKALYGWRRWNFRSKISWQFRYIHLRLIVVIGKRKKTLCPRLSFRHFHDCSVMCFWNWESCFLPTISLLGDRCDGNLRGISPIRSPSAIQHLNNFPSFGHNPTWLLLHWKHPV